MAASARLLPVELSTAGSIASKSECRPNASAPGVYLGRSLPSHSVRQRCLGKPAGGCLLGSFRGRQLRDRKQTHVICAPPAYSQRGSLRASSAADKGTIAVAGGTGFIGSKLVEKLLDEGYRVKVLTRSAGKARSVFPGKSVEIAEPHQWNQALAGTTGVVNLVGTPIATRWNEEVKADIKDSRIKTTKRLVDAINALPEKQRPKAFVSSSALGYYGISDTARFVEDSPSGKDYLAQVCQEWEAAAKGVNGPRLVLVRTGIVLDKDGGALAKMIPLFQLFAGGPLGSGRQWFSWVHRDDLANLIIEALENPKYEGPVNGTAPNPVTLGEMCDKLGQALGRPSWLPVPEFAVRSLLGEGASTVLEGQRVLPKKAQDLGFRFKYPEISGALRAIVAS